VEAQPAPRSPDDPAVPAGRDPFVDLVRAGSLVVVVLYHWCFTVFDWRADGPHASNPIGYTRGLWLLTWALQVMPLVLSPLWFAGTYLLVIAALPLWLWLHHRFVTLPLLWGYGRLGARSRPLPLAARPGGVARG
jgi:hypothetical protein